MRAGETRLMGIIEKLFAGSGTKKDNRTDQKQEELQSQESHDLILYQITTCPYCIRVRRKIDRLGLEIKMVDVYREPERRRELIREGGDSMVPCLKIRSEQGEVTWMYESADIVNYLDGRFGSNTA